jgi:3-dehydroquinate synthase class II
MSAIALFFVLSFSEANYMLETLEEGTEGIIIPITDETSVNVINHVTT